MHNKLPESSLRVPSDMAVIVAGVTALVSLGLMALIVAAVVVVVGCIVFTT